MDKEMRIICLIIFLWLVFVWKFVHIEIKWTEDSDKDVNERLTKALRELEEIHKNNIELNQQVLNLTEKLNDYEKKNFQGNELKAPPEKYELLRRRIFSNTKEFWYCVSSELRTLNIQIESTETRERIEKIKEMVDEHYRSLINDVSNLAVTDGYSMWRLQEFKYLTHLVQKRLTHLQNPPDCDKAKKLVCHFRSNNWCGYGCRIHHMIKCVIVAYATERTVVLDSKNSWKISSAGWQKFFLPLSNTCLSTDNETFVHWPGNPDTQVVHLTLPLAENKQSPRPPFIPVVIPEDMAPRLNVLHGDPPVWWIGQFLKFMFRPQPSTSDKFNEYAEKVQFQKPIVGVQIRRTDKIHSEAALHELDEYMTHVEEYYRVKELNGKVDKKRIYLATDEPKLFDEAKLKYPHYEIIGDQEISKTGTPDNRELDDSILNIIIDIHFLSHCDYLVCTFSSNVCRMAYELMNTLQPDASALFKSLDDTFYFSGQIHRLTEAVLPHKADGPQEMDLEVGDQIEVAGNHWNGYSKGKNLRLGKTLLYPSFKVKPVVETTSFASYPNITLSTLESQDDNL